ncbi:uncharacterized protein LY89DRAFT_732697 [Mollisia scopiformis]|uniref:Uncharacterized protein n=1 Tax=Mollisia scopiformis TaxID=149040 RepID=A0A194XE19_MOLSC|nr:uncharacterized protein LY89DRAFT_732697 [Mollisia scopiformis]KUJ17997.1 hypothetical protein LY89DRAFT_732697 [Mollisia scopiformis]
MANMQRPVRQRGELFRQRGIFLPSISTTAPIKRHQHISQQLEYSQDERQQNEAQQVAQETRRRSNHTSNELTMSVPESRASSLEQYQEFFNNRLLRQCLDPRYFVPGPFLRELDDNDPYECTGEALYKKLFKETRYKVSYFEKGGRRPAQVTEFWDGVRESLQDGDSEQYQDWPPEDEELVPTEQARKHKYKVTAKGPTRWKPNVREDWKKNAEYMKYVRGYLMEKKRSGILGLDARTTLGPML